MLPYAVVIFLSAFLLFQIQPIIAKMILPWFGGSSTVWSTCMLFFQAALLLGYAYAHWLHERLAGRKQAAVHSLILLASLATLPVVPSASWKPGGEENPSLLILALLAATVGLPYFLLSTTSPLLQAWYARTHSGEVPYRLFALSNLASMLALVSYPVLVEPNLATRVQAHVWSGGYACFVVFCGALSWAAVRGERSVCHHRVEIPERRLLSLWMALAACASMLLLSVTTFLTQDVAAVPFLWILPLSVYLLSFIVCFDSPQRYWRKIYLPLLAVALWYLAYLIQPGSKKSPMVGTIAAVTASLFVCCMVCHGELVSRKPHPRHLTVFYLMVSLGGALGGVFVGLIAPNLFNAYYEFPIGMALCATLAVTLLTAGKDNWRWKAPALTLLAGYLVFLSLAVRGVVHGKRVVARNFYGQLRVVDEGTPDEEDAHRKLLHGVINHGQQMQNEAYSRLPVSYFCPDTGVGRAMQLDNGGRPRRIGILGLGCGTLAAYGRRGDTFRIYEINPLVLDLARTQFTYLRDTPANVEVALGDGRLSLEREASQQFDVLVMDAFSGDSLPVHLITREAFETYFRHLKPGGILAINISNRYLDLQPVMERAASYFGKAALLFDTDPPEEDFLCFRTRWVLVLDRRIAWPRSLVSGQVLGEHRGFRIWTDDFSNMYRILE